MTLNLHSHLVFSQELSEVRGLDRESDLPKVTQLVSTNRTWTQVSWFPKQGSFHDRRFYKESLVAQHMGGNLDRKRSNSTLSQPYWGKVLSVTQFLRLWNESACRNTVDLQLPGRWATSWLVGTLHTWVSGPNETKNMKGLCRARTTQWMKATVSMTN